MSIKSLISLLPLLTVGVNALVPPPSAANCKQNQCFTQVSANRFAPTAFRSSGCVSFMASTVTPAPTTVTKTVAQGFDSVTPGPSCPTLSAGPSQVPNFASGCANSAQFVSACGCFGLTSMSTRTAKRCTSTVLVTTSTPTSVRVTTITTGTGTRTSAVGTTIAATTSFARVAAPTGCSNQGLAFAVFNNDVTDSQTGYYNFEPSSFTNPLYMGSINQIQNFYSPDAQDQVAIYSQYVHSSNAYVLNHFAYLFAPESGTYTFTASNVNDIFNFWIGDVAYNGWTRENDNIDTYFFFSSPAPINGQATGIPGAASYSVQLVGGLYYPFRYVFGQDTGAATFNFGVTAPDGTQMFNSADPYSPYLVRFSCDGVLAPPFPAFAGTAGTGALIAGL